MMLKSSKATNFASVIALTFGLTAAAVQAQSSDPVVVPTVPGTADAAATIDPSTDIIVYAQKGARGDSIQKTPIAITAVTGALIDQTKARDVIEVSRIAPNVSFSQASTLPGFGNFFIRGVGQANSTPTVDPAVNIVVDGMVYDFQGATNLDAFDIDGIEVLRGPQGILFGKNSTGGAVSLRTRRPTEDFDLRAQASIGNLGRREAAVSVSGPLAGETVLGKIAVLYRRMDGLVYDNNGGTFIPAPLNPSGLQPTTSTGRIGDDRTLIVRPTLTFKPSPDFTVNILGEYLRQRGGGSPSQNVIGYGQKLLTSYGFTPPTDKSETNVNDRGSLDVDAKRIVAEVNWDVGPGVITSITGYRNVDYGFSFDADGSPFIIMQFTKDNINTSSQFSEELRFASTFSRTVDLVAGLYYDQHKQNVQEVRLQSSTLLGDLTAPGTIYIYRNNYDQNVHSYAAFGNVRWKVTPELSLNVGGRYTHDNKKLDFMPFQRCAGTYGTGNSTYAQVLSVYTLAGCPNGRTRVERGFSDFSPKVGVDYQAGRNIFLYASWSNGFRSGNFNGRATSLAAVGPADPESVQSYEAGVKTTFLDGRARINVAAYYSKYSDIQLTVRQGIVQLLANAASGTIKGFEIESSFKPVDSIEITGNIGYTDAGFDRFTSPIPGLTIEDSLTRKFQKVPNFTGFAALAHYARIGDAKLTSRISYSYEASSYLDTFNSPFAFRKARGYLDANLTLEKDRWSASLFGRNLTNVRAVDQVNTIFVPTSFGSQARSYGLTLGFKY